MLNITTSPELMNTNIETYTCKDPLKCWLITMPQSVLLSCVSTIGCIFLPLSSSLHLFSLPGVYCTSSVREKLETFGGRLPPLRPVLTAAADPPILAWWILKTSFRFWALTSLFWISSTTRVGNQPRSLSCSLSPIIQPGAQDDKRLMRIFKETPMNWTRGFISLTRMANKWWLKLL